jgi:outer membrane immunogenic protein
MRKFIAAIILSGGATMAQAADLGPLPYRVPPPPMVLGWTGFYVGANVGGGWSVAKSTFDFAGGPAFASASNPLTGAVGGGQAGYNWQTGPLVLGVEADIQASSLKGSLTAPPCPASICGVDVSASYTQKMDWFGTVRGRLGYATDAWLVYGTAGYAYGNATTEASASAGAVSASTSRKEFRDGFVVGGGVEFAFAPRWTAKAEYLYLDFGSANTSWTFTGIPTVNDRIKIYENVVRGGVNYRF